MLRQLAALTTLSEAPRFRNLEGAVGGYSAGDVDLPCVQVDVFNGQRT